MCFCEGPIAACHLQQQPSTRQNLSFAQHCVYPPFCFCRHKQYLVRTSRHHTRFQMPPAAAKAPSQPAPETAAAQSDLHAPLSARESPGKQKIARGDTEVPLPFASQLVDLLGVTFQDAAGKAFQFCECSHIRKSLCLQGILCSQRDCPIAPFQSSLCVHTCTA